MPGRGRKGRGWGQGRRRGSRRISYIPNSSFYKPQGVPLESLEITIVRIEELEALRLCDVEGLTQEEAAARMGISRRTFWNDLKSARFKIADALLKGKAIQVIGGDFVLDTGSLKKKKEDE